MISASVISVKTPSFFLEGPSALPGNVPGPNKNPEYFWDNCVCGNEISFFRGIDEVLRYVSLPGLPYFHPGLPLCKSPSGAEESLLWIRDSQSITQAEKAD